jgi:hypothetical protein
MAMVNAEIGRLVAEKVSARSIDREGLDGVDDISARLGS